MIKKKNCAKQNDGGWVFMFIGFAAKGDFYWLQAAKQPEQTPLRKIQEYLER